MYRPSISIQYDVLSLPLPLFSTAPQSFSVNETTARPILLNNITCAGTETRLTDCPRSGVGTHNCSHTHNVVVSCRGAYHYIMLKTTHSCRMRIEHSYIYVHNIFDVCMGQHDPFSPTSKLKVTICYWLADVKFYIFCFQCIQICNHTYCLLMEIMVPLTVLTSMQVAFSS